METRGTSIDSRFFSAKPLLHRDSVVYISVRRLINAWAQLTRRCCSTEVGAPRLKSKETIVTLSFDGQGRRQQRVKVGESKQNEA